MNQLFVCWEDYRNGALINKDIYCRYININSTSSVLSNTIELCLADDDQINPFVKVS